MFVVILCSAVLVILPIFHVQYQRFLSSIPTPDTTGQFLELPAGRQRLRKGGNASFDGAASETASESTSDPRPGRAATTSAYEKREARKPWDPPFPMRSRTPKDPYLVLRRGEEEERNEDKGSGEDSMSKRTSTSQVPHEWEEDGLLGMGHLPVTDLPSHSVPTAPHLTHSPVQMKESQTAVRSGPEAQETSTLPTPQPAAATTESRGRLTLVQSIVLVLASVLFVFAFAILVAHCMAWFIVSKTEARLGEVRKGLLRGGDMRVCLYAR
jgi:hypothetical protein